MKRSIRISAVMAILFLGTSAGSYAQGSDGNYWVVEGNTKEAYTLVHYYDKNHQLIADEKLDGKFLDISRKKNIRRLNKKLAAITTMDDKAKEKNIHKKSSTKSSVRS